jgi:hypothetical protein
MMIIPAKVAANRRSKLGRRLVQRLRMLLFSIGMFSFPFFFLLCDYQYYLVVRKTLRLSRQILRA